MLPLTRLALFASVLLSVMLALTALDNSDTEESDVARAAPSQATESQLYPPNVFQASMHDPDRLYVTQAANPQAMHPLGASRLSQNKNKQ